MSLTRGAPKPPVTDSAAVTSSVVVLVAPASNDVWELLEGQPNLQRTETVAAGLRIARPGDGLVVMATGYPTDATPVPLELLAAAERGVRVYVEFAGAGLPLLTHSGGSGGCLNRTAAMPTAIVTSSAEGLCTPSPGSDVSRIKYTGVACGGAGARLIRWTSMVNLAPATKDKSKQCSWNASAESATWAALWTGGCGEAPTMVHGLPTKFCGGSPSPSPPPAAPPVVALKWTQRAVITTDELAPGLPRWRILQPQSPSVVSWCPSCDREAGHGPGCAAACSAAILSTAQIAGFNSAAFNATAAELSPLLFRLPPSGNASKTAVPMLVSTTRLSSFKLGRFSPSSAWRGLWNWILEQLQDAKDPQSRLELPTWKPSVRPAFRMSSVLPADGETAAAAASARWLANASTLVVANDERRGNESSICCVQQEGQVCVEHNCSALDVCPSPYAPAGVVNSTCAQEGWSSVIKEDGSQAMMPLFIRTDGNSEAAMGLATVATMLPKTAANTTSAERARWRRLSAQIFDYVYRWSDSQSYVNLTASAPEFGFVWWNQQHPGRYAHFAAVDYGDNMGNVIIGATTAMSLLRTQSWKKRLLYHLFAAARTTGRKGYRPSSVALSSLQHSGWAPLFESQRVPGQIGAVYQPHYGGYPTALNCWAGSYTTLHPLFSAPCLGWCEGYMAGYVAGNWTWNESMSNEQARMLLPLAWLVRANPTIAKYRGWLKRVATDLIVSQQPNGGVKQRFGTGTEAKRCSPCAPASNAAYGSGEGPIMFDGSEPLTDSLYTLNFLLAGLREAVGASLGHTDHAMYADAEGKLASYMVKIQAVSEAQPQLQGAWFRAFDYENEEFWGSDNDWGYGPWVTETGWSNGWIMTALALRGANRTLWDTMSASGLRDGPELLSVCREMLGAKAPAFCAPQFQS